MNDVNPEMKTVECEDCFEGRRVVTLSCGCCSDWEECETCEGTGLVKVPA